MPGEDRLEKRKEQYRKLYDKLGQIKSKDPYAAEKMRVRNAFGLLNEKINALSVKEGENFKKLSKEEVRDMTLLYENVMKSLNGLNSKMSDKYKEIRGTGYYEDLSKGQKKQLKTMQTEMDYFDLITNTVSKDINSFYDRSKKPEGCDIHEIYENSRTYAGYKVKEGQNLSKDSGNMNSRLAVTIVDEKGNEIEGYFTEDSVNTVTEEQEKKAKFEENKKKFGSNASFMSFDKLEDLYFGAVDESNYSSVIQGELADHGYERGMEILRGVAKKNNYEDLDSIINTPEKYRVFIDMVQDYASISNKHNVNKSIGLSEKGHLNRRNTAMSNMAKLLGCDDLLADAENVKLNIDGKQVKGTFMKKAIGSDIHKMDTESDMLLLTPKSVENLNLKKQLANLQVLDYICGNPDRHMGNMMYDCVKDKDGNVIMKGIQGIDNDSAFGSSEYSKVGMSSIRLEDMKVITKSMADKILNMNKETLVNMFYGYEIDGKEIDNMTKRLETLQEKIKADNKVYAQGYGKGTLISDKIKIVDDDELEMLGINSGLASYSKGKTNYFARVKELSEGQKNITNVIKNAVADVRKSVKSFTSDSLKEMTKITDSIAADDKMLQTGSPEYTKMRNSTKSILEDLRAFHDMPFKKTGDSFSAGDRLKAINDKIALAIKDCEAYKEYKHNRNQREGKPDIDPRPHKLTRAERRWQNVERNLEFLKKQQKLFKDIEEKYAKVNETVKRCNEMKPELDKRTIEVKDQMDLENMKKKDSIKYENLKSRSRFSLAEEAIKLKEAGENNDPAALAKATLSYNIKIGYALKAISNPQERTQFRQSVEKLTGIKSELSDEEMFKRAVASNIVNTKLDLMLKQKNGSISKMEKMTLDKLKNVEIKPDSNGYNDLMKDEAFNSFYEKESQRFDINSPVNKEKKEGLGEFKVSDIFEAGMAYAGAGDIDSLYYDFKMSGIAERFNAEAKMDAVKEKVPVTVKEEKTIKNDNQVLV